MPNPTLPSACVLGGANVLGAVLAQAPSPLAGYEQVIRLVPELAIAAALFFVVKYYNQRDEAKQKRFDEERKADNDRRDEAMTEALGEFREALRETNERGARQNADIVAELRTSSSLAREQNDKQFGAIVGITREAITGQTELRSAVLGLQADIRELKDSDRRRSALPPPGGAEFRGGREGRGGRDADVPRDPGPA
jgi:hypothetical protein